MRAFFRTLILLIGCIVSAPVDAQIVTHPASSASVNDDALTFSHQVASGSNRLLVVSVAVAEKDTSVVSVSYAGLPLSLITSGRGDKDDGDLEIWGRIAPPVGTSNVVVTLTKKRHMVGGAVSFANVHQTTPFGTPSLAQDKSALASATVSSAAGEVVFAGLVVNGDVNTATPGTGQSLLWQIQEGSGGKGALGAGSTKPGATSVTVSWTLNKNTAWAIVAIPIRPVAPPALSAILVSTPFLDPVRGMTNPLAIPGALVDVTASVQNLSPGSPDNDSTYVALALSPRTSLFVGDLMGNGSGPVIFTDGSTPSTLSFSFTSLSSLTDDIEFSNNGGASWTYAPTPDASQLDANVTTMRIRLRGVFAGKMGTSTPQLDLRYRLAVN